MEIQVYSREDKSLIGIIEVLEYIRWTRRYSLCGDFELKTVASKRNLELLQIGNWVGKGGYGEAGIIEDFEITHENDGDRVTVRGGFCLALLSRRIVWGTENISGDVSGGIHQLLTKHAINPSNTAREFSSPFTYDPVPLGANVTAQISYANLMTAITDICSAKDIGVRMMFQSNPRRLEFELYRGTNKSIVFSPEYDNVVSMSFSHSTFNHANVALVGGEGEGSNRTLVIAHAGEYSEAFDARYEIFVDARDMQSEGIEGNYLEELKFRGTELLAESEITMSLDAEVYQFGNLVYGVDYDLGDVVTISAKDWGVTAQRRIIEIEESYDRNGRTLNVIFGKPVMGLMQKIRRGV